MSSSSSEGSDCQITDVSPVDQSPKSMLHDAPIRYILVPDKFHPIRKRPNMIWPAALSTFVLNRVCEFVMKEKAGVPLFRHQVLKAVFAAIMKYAGREVCVPQVYNHLRYWRARWVHVCKLKKMEEVRWVKKILAIMMDDDTYFVYTKNHSRDAELLNRPIENYAQMKRIYIVRVAAALLTSAAVHRDLSHLMDHKAHATKYLPMTPDARMDRFNAFLTKYYM